MMNTKKKYQEQAPEWITKEVANMPDPDEAALARYDYMREDFMAALQTAVVQRKAKQAGKGVVDAVVTLAGKVREWATEILVESLPVGQPFAPMGLSRGVSSVGQGQKAPPSALATERIGKESGKALIEGRIIKEGTSIIIEINLLDRQSGLEIRPFTVQVADGEGKEVASTMHIDPLALAPRYPYPNPGIYVFHLTWRSGTEDLRLEVV